MGDYYAILGIERGAPREAIKAAYRRLARETHPDRKTLSTEAEKLLGSRQMAELNSAFAVLYDIKQRREYDEQLHVNEILIQTPAGPKNGTSVNASSSTGQRSRSRPRGNFDSNVVVEFSNHLRLNLCTDRRGFSWKQKDLAGFDWALASGSWSFQLWVSLRSFICVDAGVAKKFISYSDAAIAQHNGHFRKSNFLFLLPFQQLQEWESVSTQCQQFSGVGKSAKTNPPRAIILLDLQYGRTFRFDSQLRGKQFNPLLERICTPA